MSTPLSVLTLVVQETVDTILSAALDVARFVELPVDTWRAGDPTRTGLRALATKLASADAIRAELAKASFITGPVGERAEGDWLSLRSQDVYGVTREEATFATPTVVLNNTGGGYYEIAAHGLTMLASATGASFSNQAPIVINPVTSGIAVAMVADKAGSDGSVSVNAIDTFVSPPLATFGVLITSSSEATGVDEQSDEGLIEQDLATLGALSPNGPVDAYEFVARNFTLTGIQGVTRASSAGDSSNGTVTVYVATTTAGLDGASVAAIQAAEDSWAQPLCTSATVVSGTPQSINITIGNVPAAGQDAASAAISAYMASVDFAGVVALDAVASAVRVALNAAGFTVSPSTPLPITVPVADVTLAAGVFPVKGSVTFA